MIRVLFVCHGNICRSPIAEFVMKDMVTKRGIKAKFYIASAATSTEEIWNGIGNPVYPPAKRELAKHGISCEGKRAVQITKADYGKYDYILGMEERNIRNILRIVGKDVKVTVGENMNLKDENLLTDGDKYYLQHDATGNKEGSNWENYQEQGTEVTSTAEGEKGVWVQVDLGASYPLEVINLKRQVYDGQATIGNGNPGNQGKRLKGTKISYKNTAIVIGNEEDLSDGQIVYYEGNPTLPDGVKQPENVSKPYEE